MNVILSDVAWNQATLTVVYGFTGVGKATDISLPAYIASMAGSHMLIQRLLIRPVHTTRHSCQQCQCGLTRLVSPKYWWRLSQVVRRSGIQRWWVSYERDCCQLHHLRRPKRVSLQQQQQLTLVHSSTLNLVWRWVHVWTAQHSKLMSASDSVCLHAHLMQARWEGGKGRKFSRPATFCGPHHRSKILKRVFQVASFWPQICTNSIFGWDSWASLRCSPGPLVGWWGGHPSLRFLPLDAFGISISAHTEVVIGPHENGFPGPTVALDGPDLMTASVVQLLTLWELCAGLSCGRHKAAGRFSRCSSASRDQTRKYFVAVSWQRYCYV